MLSLMSDCPVGFSSGFRCTPYVYMQREAANTKPNCYPVFTSGRHIKGNIGKGESPPITSVLFQVFTSNTYLCVAFVGAIVHLGKLPLT